MIELSRNIDLSPYTTFRLPVRAAFYTELHNAAQLPFLTTLPEFQNGKVLWLGGGSNIVFKGDFDGLVVRMANRGITLLTQDDNTVRIEVQAGEVWHDFVRHSITQGWYGLENLSLIPGTVGAAPVQNIGAYGVEVKDRIESVRCFDLHTQQFITLSQQECAFAYRDSLFKRHKGRYVIVSVIFALHTRFSAQIRYGDVGAVLAEICGGREITAQDVSDAVCRIRRSKLPDPAHLGNVGSFYKNPIVSAEQAAGLTKAYPAMPHYPQADGSIKLAAGWLIEQCGLKGTQVGQAAVHDRQALVLVNKGGATAADVQALSERVCAAVVEKFGVQLHSEPDWV